MRSDLISFCTLLSVSLVPLTSFAHREGGNGGDILKCNQDGKVIYRVLDSVVIENYGAFELKNYQTSAEAFESIYKKLDQTFPLLKLKLKDFVSSFGNSSSIKDGKTLWLKGKLTQVKDENLIADIPVQCDSDPIQTVTAVKSPSNTYYYDPELISLIQNQKDEFSWIMVHEWLRDYHEDAQVIRLFNGYLHSKEFLASSEEEVRAALIRFGLKEKEFRSSRSQLGWPEKSFEALQKRTVVLENEISNILQIDPKDLKRKEKDKLAIILWNSLRQLDFNDWQERQYLTYFPEYQSIYDEADRLNKDIWKRYKLLKE